MDQMVLGAQIWLNETYKDKIHHVSEDGITGWGTIRALTKALQLELGVGADGIWGPGTESRCPTISSNSGNKNIITILQCGLYCKGYEGGGIDGNYTAKTSIGVSNLKKDAGLLDTSGSATPLIFKALLSTMDGFVLASTGNANVRKIQQNLNRDYHKVIGLIACNGVYSRDTNRALIKALQVEEGSGADGIWGPGTQSKCPTIPGSRSNKRFVLLLQYALCVNGVDPHGFDGLFGSGLSNAIKEFQSFCALPADGYAGKQVWASLLVSTGDKNRKGTACDCSTTITPAKAQTLKNNGYKLVGRYLTGKFKMTQTEINTILSNGLRIFPIFETGGYKLSYFNPYQGVIDARTAIKKAHDFGFDAGTIIYFTVDFDALDGNVTSAILPYFNQISNVFKRTKTKYKVGIYAPRNVCSRVAKAGFSCSSFVCDMSTGFSGNLGFPLPNDWAIDQISTISIGTGDGLIEIDNNIMSGKDHGVSYVKLGNDAAGIEDTIDLDLDNVVIYQTKKHYTTTENGNLADDLKTNDFTKDEILKINSLFKYQIDESDTPDMLFKEFSKMTTNFFSRGEMEDVILDMINHFKTGNGTSYSNNILTKHVINHKSTQEFIDFFKKGLINQLIKNNGDLASLRYIEGSSNPLYDYLKKAPRPVYNEFKDILNGLTITIDDIWGHNATVKNYSLKGKHFTGILHFNIYDHFGLDKPDVEKIYADAAGFRAWFVLQHYNKFKGKYKPFVTKIEFDILFEGYLN